MSFLQRLFRRAGDVQEQRATVESPKVPISNRAILEFFGLSDGDTTFDRVTTEDALAVPAYNAGMMLYSGSAAMLPLQLFRREEDNAVKVQGQLQPVLGEAVNPGLTSFDWREGIMQNVWQGGRSYTYIERNVMGRVLNLWPLDPAGVDVVRRNGRIRYVYADGISRSVEYDPQEMIDIAWQRKPDMIRHRSPIHVNRVTIGLAKAVAKFGSRYFANGGVPPFAIEGGFQSPGGVERAGDDLTRAVMKASAEGKSMIPIPDGHKLHEIGQSPEKAQLVEFRRFLVEEVARIYGVPPTFLQDLTNGTFSNTEQADIHYVKHSLGRWLRKIEQELDLKLFGMRNRAFFVRFNLDAMLRGQFKDRMEGYQSAINSAVMTPNQAKALEELPADPDGDMSMIQGATTSLSNAVKPTMETAPAPPAPDPDEEPQDDED